MSDSAPRPLTAVLDVPAAPCAVWRVISDVRRTGEWSPECHTVTPLGPIRRGTLLLGRNRRMRTRWATISRLTEVSPEQAIGWTVLTNRSQWRYELEEISTAGPAARCTRVTHTRRTPHGEGRFALWFTQRFLDGQVVHDNELEAGMAAGLQRIADLVAQESAAGMKPGAAAETGAGGSDSH